MTHVEHGVTQCFAPAGGDSRYADGNIQDAAPVSGVLGTHQVAALCASDSPVMLSPSRSRSAQRAGATSSALLCTALAAALLLPYAALSAGHHVRSVCSALFKFGLTCSLCVADRAVSQRRWRFSMSPRREHCHGEGRLCPGEAVPAGMRTGARGPPVELRLSCHTLTG